ncbi:prepilin peptidase [Pullulanibacillus camelliae]|uniref:prepilin peptidase n=1 Tax=Pullulanibacillus camelliae TaxID=1707096 RepID=UPI0016677CA5|nr:A24 family peptidase [Pullulanibacillus camelliae]
MGSFFTLVSFRLPLGNSIIHPPSHCDFCERRLTVSELIPILSFLLLKGKCQTCSQRIPITYPLIECFTGLLYIFILYYCLHHHQPLLLPISLSFSAMLIILTLSDLTYFLVPNKLLLFFILLFGLLHLLFTWNSWAEALLGACISLILLFLASLVIKNGMGYGDIKLFGVLGFVLGWKDSLLALFIACFVGMGITFLAQLLRKRKRKGPIPFVPFLAIGAFTAFFYGDSLLQAYVSFVKDLLLF